MKSKSLWVSIKGRPGQIMFKENEYRNKIKISNFISELYWLLESDK